MENYIKCYTKEFKISVITWNDLTDGSYSVPDIQDYFEYILRDVENRLTILQ